MIESISGLKIFSPYKVSLCWKNTPEWKFPQICSLELIFWEGSMKFQEKGVSSTETQIPESRFVDIFGPEYFFAIQKPYTERKFWDQKRIP